jgi:hypothetical protein
VFGAQFLHIGLVFTSVVTPKVLAWFSSCLVRDEKRLRDVNTALVWRKLSQQKRVLSSTMRSQYRFELKESLKGPEMSRKCLSPGSLALVIVVFGTALARAFASAYEPQGCTVPVSVQFCLTAIAFTMQVSGCPSKPCAILMSRVTGFVVRLCTASMSFAAKTQVPVK